MLTKRESELQSDCVTATCPHCGWEYELYVKWGDWTQLIREEKFCDCPLDSKAESEAVESHFNPPEPDWARPEIDERIDYEDTYYD